MKIAEVLKIKAQVSSIWAKGCMFDDCVCVFRVDMTTPHWWKEKVTVYYYDFNYYCNNNNNIP